MTTDPHELAAAYVLDALDPGERRAFEAHLADSEASRAEVHDLREVAAALATTVEADPPPALRDRVLAQLADTPQLPPLAPTAGAPEAPAPVVDLSEARRRRWGGLPVAVAAAAAVVALLVGIGVGRSLEGTTGPGSEVAAVLGAPDAAVSRLDGATGEVRLVWSPDRDQVAVFAPDLADPGAGSTYALWAVGEDGLRPAGTFDPTGSGEATVLDVGAVDPDEWGVTIEPEGGSRRPTGEILYTGTA